jgi:RNA polymerase sigma-70 factor (ECF subfamily)
LFSGKFFSLCLKYSGSYEQAKDNLQEGFIKIFENISQYNGKGSFEGWMTRIIINTCLREYQGSIFFSEFDDNLLQNSLEDEVSVDEEEIPVDFLIRIIDELPERYRLVFNLYVFEEFSHQEIAVMLKISIGTSKSNLARARQKLKEKIEIGDYLLKGQANEKK